LLGEISQLSNLDAIKDVAFLRYGYEVYKGLTPFLQAQRKLSKTSDPSEQAKYGIGLIWLPRPHFEIMAELEQLRTSSGLSTEGLLLFHYYL
jgi:hypothetical protein